MKFQEHGRFHIAIEGNLLRVSASGSFNEEAVKQYVKSVEDNIKHFGRLSFGIVLDLTHVEGATPQAWQIIGDHNTALAANPALVGKSIICHSSLVSYFAGKVNIEKHKSKIKVFDSHEEGLAWLQAQF